MGGTVCVQLDVPDPTYVPTGEWMNPAHSVVVDVGEAPDRIFLHGAMAPNEMELQQAPFNGVYVKQEDLHRGRSYYVKSAGGRWVLRFHPKAAMWIVDGEIGPLKDDSKGSCSAACDCW